MNQAHFTEVITLLSKKALSALLQVRLGTFNEGPSAQIMHVGSYDEEGPTVARLHAFIEEKGYELRGKHHEIYLGDPRRSAPDRLKTIIRQPILYISEGDSPSLISIIMKRSPLNLRTFPRREQLLPYQGSW